MSLEEFIKTQIESVDELRALLLLSSAPHVQWDALAVAARLYLRPAIASKVLARLAGKQFLAGGDQPEHYRYQPQTQELADWVKAIAELDRKQPVTLINMVYSRPRDLQAFSDAFKIKKEKD